jgi:hypothetical protein
MVIDNAAERPSIAEMLARLAEVPLPGTIEVRDVEPPEPEDIALMRGPGPDEA